MSSLRCNTIESLDGTVSVDVKDIAAGSIESGSNYIKYPNGTLECWGTEATKATTNDAGGNIWVRYRGADIFTYPIPFVGANPFVTASVHEENSMIGAAVGVVSNTPLLTSPAFRMSGYFNASSGKLGYRAVGRWK